MTFEKRSKEMTKGGNGYMGQGIADRGEEKTEDPETAYLACWRNNEKFSGAGVK